jgi:hypothetical protein
VHTKMRSVIETSMTRAAPAVSIRANSESNFKKLFEVFSKYSRV